MTTRAYHARHVLMSSAALALFLAVGPAAAQDKPATHADGPAAAYEPSMTPWARFMQRSRAARRTIR